MYGVTSFATVPQLLDVPGLELNALVRVQIVVWPSDECSTLPTPPKRDWRPKTFAGVHWTSGDVDPRLDVFPLKEVHGGYSGMADIIYDAKDGVHPTMYKPHIGLSRAPLATTRHTGPAPKLKVWFPPTMHLNSHHPIRVLLSTLAIACDRFRCGQKLPATSLSENAARVEDLRLLRMQKGTGWGVTCCGWQSPPFPHRPHHSAQLRKAEAAAAGSAGPAGGLQPGELVHYANSVLARARRQTDAGKKVRAVLVLAYRISAILVSSFRCQLLSWRPWCCWSGGAGDRGRVREVVVIGGGGGRLGGWRVDGCDGVVLVVVVVGG